MNLKQYITRFWNSATITTWGSYLAKSLNYVVLLPLVLTSLEEGDIAIWLLFATFLSLISIADVGFSVTFIRAFAYAYGGAQEIKNYKDFKSTSTGEVNWLLISRVKGTAFYVYLCLSCVLLVLMLGIGSGFLERPVEAASSQREAWMSWFFVVGASVVKFYGNTYTSYLQGLNKIAVYRRWEVLFSVVETGTSVAVLLVYNNLLLLVVTQQLWIVLNVIRNRQLCRSIYNGRYRSMPNEKIDKSVFRGIFPSAFRTWLAIVFSSGATQMSGVIFAQYGTVEASASYLLALRLITVIDQFSRSPFYSKIPIISKRFAENKVSEMMRLVNRGMILTLLTYSCGYVFVGLVGSRLMDVINSNAQFPSIEMWILLGFAFFSTRHAALFLQWHSISNDVVAHVANGVSGIFFVTIAYLGMSSLGEYVFPVGLIVSNVLFANWYAVIKVKKMFNIEVVPILKSTTLVPLCMLILFSIFIFLIDY